MAHDAGFRRRRGYGGLERTVLPRAAGTFLWNRSIQRRSATGSAQNGRSRYSNQSKSAGRAVPARSWHARPTKAPVEMRRLGEAERRAVEDDFAGAGEFAFGDGIFLEAVSPRA